MASSSANKTPSYDELTFGVEFECLVHADKIGLTAAEKASLRGRPFFPRQYLPRVASALQRVLDLLKPDITHPVKITPRVEGDSVITTEDENAYKEWIVKTEDSVTADEELPHDDDEYAGMEIMSPILANTKFSRDQCAMVAEAIRSTVGVFNDKCGFHVHVGRGDRGFEVLTLKKLYSLLVLGGEAILNGLLRPSRRDNYYCRDMTKVSAVIRFPHVPFDLTGSAPYEWFSRCLPVDSDDVVPGHIKEALWKVWRAKDIDEFCGCVEGNKNVGVWFGNLDTFEHFGYGKRTIEFRKAEGNLGLTEPSNMDFVFTWPEVCVRLVAFAIDSDPEEFGRVVNETVEALRLPSSAEKVRKFLTSLGLNSETIKSLVARAEALS
ncbi:hypothetical protein DL768_010171 [Monosporascus sp. mg162]|nr:hypothetical protein DL768_010171 [Monosporascus sp. mg162]